MVTIFIFDHINIKNWELKALVYSKQMDNYRKGTEGSVLCYLLYLDESLRMTVIVYTYKCGDIRKFSLKNNDLEGNQGTLYRRFGEKLT